MSQKLTRAQERIMLEQATILDKNVMRVLRVAEKVDKNNPQIGWLRKEVDMGSRADPMFIMNKIKSKIFDFSEHIYAKNEAFFTENNGFINEKYVKNDARREFMVGFIQMIQKNISKVPANQKEQVWGYLIELTDAIFKYRDADPDDTFILQN